MPTYDYKCKECSADFAIVKSMAEIDNIEHCPSCKIACDKSHRIIKTAKEFYGEKPDEPFFSQALGKWVKGNTDMRRQAKARGLIEIGNENVDKMYESAERSREKTANDRWRSITDPTPYQIRGA